MKYLYRSWRFLSSHSCSPNKFWRLLILRETNFEDCLLPFETPRDWYPSPNNGTIGSQFSKGWSVLFNEKIRGFRNNCVGTCPKRWVWISNKFILDWLRIFLKMLTEVWESGKFVECIANIKSEYHSSLWVDNVHFSEARVASYFCKFLVNFNSKNVLDLKRNWAKPKILWRWERRPKTIMWLKFSSTLVAATADVIHFVSSPS